MNREPYNVTFSTDGEEPLLQIGIYESDTDTGERNVGEIFLNLGSGIFSTSGDIPNINPLDVLGVVFDELTEAAKHFPHISNRDYILTIGFHGEINGTPAPHQRPLEVTYHTLSQLQQWLDSGNSYEEVLEKVRALQFDPEVVKVRLPVDARR